MTPAETHHQRGLALRRQGRAEEALAELETAAGLAPGHPMILLNLGATLLDLDRAAAAADVLSRAVALVPQVPEARNILGCALLGAGRVSAARHELEEALRLRRSYSAAHDNLGRVCRAQGCMAEALEHFQAALAGAPTPATHSNALLAGNYVGELAPAELVGRHREWDRRHARALRPARRRTALPRAGRRLRIGYVSPDFCQHAVAFFIAPVLAAHDRGQFEVFCYYNRAGQDAVTAALRSVAEHWRDIPALNDEAVAELIRQDEIDILVDLAGHTAGHRLPVFARQAAPVQITWLGYPNTTGMAAMDYRITDDICLPAGDDTRHGPEELLRLPDVFCCYPPPPDCPPPAAPAGGADRPFTFCSFNHFAKLSAGTIAVWARILAECPGAQLLLKSPGAGDPGTQAHCRGEFARHGTGPERIRFNGEALPMRRHLELYHGCDLALDPFPYNGTTTTCEALLMGVPVVTLAGATHAARVGASFLRCVGLSGLVASDKSEYVRRAVRLAADADRRAELRLTLRSRLLAGPLGQGAAFTRNYEAALVRAWDAAVARDRARVPVAQAG